METIQDNISQDSMCPTPKKGVRKTALEKYQERQIEKKAIKERRKKAAKAREAKKRLEARKKETKKRRFLKRREKYWPQHLKRLKSKQNRRAYIKRRKVQLAEKKKNGDRYGYYRIVLAKNHKITEELTTAWWMLTAYEKYNNFIAENRAGVICDKRISQNDSKNGTEVIYEILLLKKIDPEKETNKRDIRNEEGMFETNVITDANKYAIIAKERWYIPETYQVYGYNPVTDRKTGRWIFDNIINKDCRRDNAKNVYMYLNKLIVMYDSDMDIIICKNQAECLRLYNGLEHEAGKNKYVFFTYSLVRARGPWLYDRIAEKTGWTRTKIKKCHG